MDNPELMNTQLYYEVVPKDCAEAPFCTFEVCDCWVDGRIPLTVNNERISESAANVFQKTDSDTTCGIVCTFGAGRAGTFLTGAIAIEKMKQGEVPDIKQIASSVRSQRPSAIETLPQYIYSYIIALTYGSKQVKNEDLKGRIVKIIKEIEAFAQAKQEELDEETGVSVFESDTE